MDEKRQRINQASTEFIDHVAEKSIVRGLIVISLGSAANDDGGGIIPGRFIMRLKTAVELRNALNELIDDPAAGTIA